MSKRQEQVSELLRQLTGTYIQQTADPSSLITVTTVAVSPDLAQATVFVSVLPEDRESPALDFLARHARDMKEYVKDNCSLRRVPTFTFAIDEGERNRQRIDELLTQEKQNTQSNNENTETDI
jgi:ribosome-binding factor A